MKKLIIYTDGGARGNPGPTGIGVVFLDKNGKVLEDFSKFIGISTNNQAEYKALIFALDLAHKKYSPQSIECFLDSELVVNQLKGLFKVKNSQIRDLIFKIRILESKYKSVNYKVIPREKNKEADKLVNKAINGKLKPKLSS